VAEIEKRMAESVYLEVLRGSHGKLHDIENPTE
jgi:hypothetical protein